MKSALCPSPSVPRTAVPMTPAGIAVIARAQPPKGIIKLGNANGLREDFNRIEIAIGVKRIAGVVTCDGNRNAGGREFFQQGHATPARRTSGRVPIL